MLKPATTTRIDNQGMIGGEALTLIFSVSAHVGAFVVQKWQLTSINHKEPTTETCSLH